jgi:hypothetical protein
MRVSRGSRAARLVPTLLLPATAPGPTKASGPGTFVSGSRLERSTTPGAPREGGPPAETR